MDSEWRELYIGDLPSSVDELFVKDLFCGYGSFPSGSISLKQHKKLDKSFAFVIFQSHELAQRALDEVNYTSLDGIPIRILWSDRHTKKIINSHESCLFISGLDESISVSQLHDAFSNFGKIVSCKIPLTKGKSRGYGYVTFYEVEDARKAREDLEGASINGKPIKIEFYKKPEKKDPEEIFTNVYICPLPIKFLKSNKDLANLMKEFGEFVETGKDNPAIMFDEDGSSFEFGFCNFKNHEDAVKAVESLNKKTHKSGEFEFVCGRAQSKE